MQQQVQQQVSVFVGASKALPPKSSQTRHPLCSLKGVFSDKFTIWCPDTVMCPDLLDRELLHPLVPPLGMLCSHVGPGHKLMSTVEEEIGSMFPKGRPNSHRCDTKKEQKRFDIDVTQKWRCQSLATKGQVGD